MFGVEHPAGSAQVGEAGIAGLRSRQEPSNLEQALIGRSSGFDRTKLAGPPAIGRYEDYFPPETVPIPLAQQLATNRRTAATPPQDFASRRARAAMQGKSQNPITGEIGRAANRRQADALTQLVEQGKQQIQITGKISPELEAQIMKIDPQSVRMLQGLEAQAVLQRRK
jgi:hypothetical protein